MNSFEEEMLDQLKRCGTISYRDILDILNAFQIASGQGFAIGRTKAILNFIRQGGVLKLENIKGMESISSFNELADVYKSIDSQIDLFAESEFKEYFS